MLSAADRFGAPLLRAACINYILGPEKNDVIDHPTFKQELEAYPLMLFPIIKAAPSLNSNSPPAKRQRTEAQPHTTIHVSLVRDGREGWGSERARCLPSRLHAKLCALAPFKGRDFSARILTRSRRPRALQTTSPSAEFVRYGWREQLMPMLMPAPLLGTAGQSIGQSTIDQATSGFRVHSRGSGRRGRWADTRVARRAPSRWERPAAGAAAARRPRARETDVNWGEGGVMRGGAGCACVFYSGVLRCVATQATKRQLEIPGSSSPPLAFRVCGYVSNN